MSIKGLAFWWATGAVLTLAACSGAADQAAVRPHAPSTATFGEGPAWGKDASRQAPAPEMAGARTGGVLTVLSDYGLPTLDPSEAYYTSTISIESGLLVRSLTQYVYDPATRQMILVPDLATDLGRPRNHFKTWQFTLRPGVRFENGRRVTPEDLKYGIERSFDRKTFPEGAPFSNEYLLDGDTYQGPYRSPGGYRGVSIHGNTITLRMARPFPDMPYWGSFPAMSPIPAGKASDPATYKNHPWSTGPYMIDRYTPGRSMTLVKNPYWRASTDPGRYQHLDGFRFDAARSAARIDATLRADVGAGQTTISMDSMSNAYYQQLTQAERQRLVLGPGSCTYLTYPDYRKVTDIAVRRALAYAFPYRKVWASQGMVPGVTVMPASNVMPPTVVGQVSYNPLPQHPPGSTNPQRARALLSASGNLGYRIRFAYQADDPSAVAKKNILVRALRTGGFTAQAVAASSATYATDFMRKPDAPINLRSVGWCSDWPTGGSWLPPLFDSTAPVGGGLDNNFAFFAERAVDARIAAVQRLPLARQPAAWSALDKLIQTDYFPVVVTGYSGVATMRGSRVHGDFVDSVLAMPTWKNIWLG